MKSIRKYFRDGIKAAAIFSVGFITGKVISDALLDNKWANWYDDGYFDGMETALNLCSPDDDGEQECST